LAALPFWRRAAILFINTLRWVFRTFVAVLTAIFSSLFLLSAFSDWFSPDYWIPSAYLGLFFPIFALLLLGWSLFLLLARRWRNLIIVVMVLLIGCERLWRYCPVHFGQQSAITEHTLSNGSMQPIDVDTLRVLTYNTLAMGEVRMPDINSKIPVLDVVALSGADIVCLQEYTFAQSKSGHHEQEVRNRLKKVYPYYAFVHNKGWDNMGVALYSKYPIKKYEAINNTDYFGATAYGEVNVNGRTLALVNCHMESFQIPNEERAFMHDMSKNFEADSIARLEKGLRHLSKAYRQRARQSLCVVEFLAKKDFSKTPLLVMGDMNDTPISFTYNKMRGNLSDTWEETGFGPGISFRDFPFWFRIDHMFHSSHIRTLDIKIMRDVTYSDHYPVLATYQLLPE